MSSANSSACFLFELNEDSRWRTCKLVVSSGYKSFWSNNPEFYCYSHFCILQVYQHRILDVEHDCWRDVTRLLVLAQWALQRRSHRWEVSSSNSSACFLFELMEISGWRTWHPEVSSGDKSFWSKNPRTLILQSCLHPTGVTASVTWCLPWLHSGHIKVIYTPHSCLVLLVQHPRATQRVSNLDGMQQYMPHVT